MENGSCATKLKCYYHISLLNYLNPIYDLKNPIGTYSRGLIYTRIHQSTNFHGHQIQYGTANWLVRGDEYGNMGKLASYKGWPNHATVHVSQLNYYTLAPTIDGGGANLYIPLASRFSLVFLLTIFWGQFTQYFVLVYILYNVSVSENYFVDKSELY